MIAPVLYRVYDICNSNPHQNMKVFLKFAVICLLSAGLFSCQKEKSFEIPLPGTDNGDDDSTTNPADNKLIGTWKFINVNINSESRMEVAGMGGSITKYQATTTNNSGTVTFDATHSKATNMGYSIDTELTIKTFGTGMDDEITTPFEFSLAPYNSSAKYKIIGTDSIYFPEGALFDMPAANPQPTPADPIATGGKFSITGNTLKMVSSVLRDTVISQGGVAARVTQKATAIATLERQ